MNQRGEFDCMTPSSQFNVTFHITHVDSPQFDHPHHTSNEHNMNMIDNLSPVVPKSIANMWKSLPPDVRAILVESELKGDDFHTAKQPTHKPRPPQRSDSCTTSPTVMTPSSSVSFSEQCSLLGSSKESDTDDDVENGLVTHEKCPLSGADFTLSPLERAPKNVFAFTKTQTTEKSEVVKTSSATITTTTKVVSTSRGWRNIFSLPISYDVNMVAHGTLFDTVNSQLLDATGVHEEGYNTRFAVVDAEVEKLYGDKIREYFVAKGIELTMCVINGGELDKRPKVRAH
jgi:hypothetical protein